MPGDAGCPAVEPVRFSALLGQPSTTGVECQPRTNRWRQSCVLCRGSTHAGATGWRGTSSLGRLATAASTGSGDRVVCVCTAVAPESEYGRVGTDGCQLSLPMQFGRTTLPTTSVPMGRSSSALWSWTNGPTKVWRFKSVRGSAQEMSSKFLPVYFLCMDHRRSFEATTAQNLWRRQFSVGSPAKAFKPPTSSQESHGKTASPRASSIAFATTAWALSGSTTGSKPKSSSRTGGKDTTKRGHTAATTT